MVFIGVSIGILAAALEGVRVLVGCEMRVSTVAVRVGKVGVTLGVSLGSCNSNRLPI
jgi:hypothetical protein